MTPQSPAPDVAAATEHLTLGRLCEIERGEGEPATTAEMAAVEEWKRSPTAHYFELQWRKSGPTILEGQRIYKNVPPHSKRRLRSMTHAESCDGIGRSGEGRLCRLPAESGHRLELLAADRYGRVAGTGLAPQATHQTNLTHL